LSASTPESEPNDTLDTANEISPGQATTGSTAPGDIDIFRLDTTSDGILVATVHAPLVSTRLSLLDSQGRLMIQSDGASSSNPDDLIAQHLAAGTYFLEVVSTAGAGDYTLMTSLAPAYQPFERFGDPSVYNTPISSGDFNGDGIVDLVTPNAVYLGLGDGTFGPPVSSGITSDALAVVTGDFNGDGRLDVATANIDTGDISILLGNGDGTFREQARLTAGDGPVSLAAGDFNGDGRLDLAVANGNSNDVSVFLGNGDGTFQSQVRYAAGNYPYSLVAGDFNGDGRLDVATANIYSNDVSVLLGNGDGTFQTQLTFAAGDGPISLVTGDFNGDRRLDLAVADSNSGEISVLLGNGDGTFRTQAPLATGDYPTSLVAGDFNGDGRLDLATANASSNEVSVLLGNGDGTFQTQVRYAAGDSPVSLVVGDFDRDGRPDLAVSNGASNDISVLLGNGDGTFREQTPGGFPAGSFPKAAVTGDFNGDGRLDLAVANLASNDVSVLLGNGDGTFQPESRVAVGAGPGSIVAGDFNGDGRLDLAVAGRYSNDVTVLLGNGDGTFQERGPYAVGDYPTSLVAADFNGDGRLDLATANLNSGDISLLVGNGDGTFQHEVRLAGGDSPVSLAAGDFNGDGRPDLAVANLNSGDVTVLLGNGDGTFREKGQFAAGIALTSISTGDFNGDGRLDLAVEDFSSAEIEVLLGNGDGTFQKQEGSPAGTFQGALVTADFNKDGRTDLAAANLDFGNVSVLLGNGDGTFQDQARFPAGISPTSVASGDFNGDGRPDLAVTNGVSNDVSLLLGDGNGGFASSSLFATPPRATPLVADFNGDGNEDVAVVDAVGDILYRQGQPGRPGSFDPPVRINAGFPSRDIALVPSTNQGTLIASVDARDDQVSLYAWRDAGFVRIGSLATGPLPAEIVSGDLNGDGWNDLVVRNAGDGSLSVFFNNGPATLQTGWASFATPLTLAVGVGVSNIALADTSGRGRLDILVTNKLTGQVILLENRGDRTFAPPAPYPASPGLSALDSSTGPTTLTSRDATLGLAAGPLTGSGYVDLITANTGSNTLGLLAGLGGGRFSNPVALPTREPAQVIRIADFNGDGIPDLALLSTKGLTIELGDGRGGFSPSGTYAAGTDPSGLTIADLNHDGRPDLIVGNSYGDVLVLMGNGDGTFQPYRKTDRAVALAVADLEHNGSSDFIFADQGLDRVVVDYGRGQIAVLGDRTSGLLAPGAVTLADLNGDGIPDLVVANSGSNNVLVYPGLGNGQFGAALNDGHGFFVGTNPVQVSVADVNGDGRPDLVVANKGSDDVSILLNEAPGGSTIGPQPVGASFTFVPGPRLKVGSGPVDTVVRDLNGDGKPDILVSNSQSDNVMLLPGVGGGFFNDQNPMTFPVGISPGPIFVGPFDGRPDLVAVNSGSSDLTVISDFLGADPVTSTVPSAGLEPLTAFAFSAGNGFEDLVVGNSSDGILALFGGGSTGLTLVSTSSEPELPSPIALAFWGLSNGQVQFYAATEGHEAAALVALNLGGDIPSQTPSPGPPPATNLAQLVPLQESSLALVGTLLTLTIESSSSSMDLGALRTGEFATIGFLPGTTVFVNQSLPSRISGVETGDDSEPASNNPESLSPEPASSTPSSWQRFLLGTDKALEQFGSQPDPFSARQDDPRPGDAPGVKPTSTPPVPDVPLGLTTPPRQPATDLRRAEPRKVSYGRRIATIDSALLALCNEERPWHRQVRSASAMSDPRIVLASAPDADFPDFSVSDPRQRTVTCGEFLPHPNPERRLASTLGLVAAVLATGYVGATSRRPRRITACSGKVPCCVDRAVSLFRESVRCQCPTSIPGP
jgi:hypothetical protein